MKHCLVIDDSSVIRKVARRILEANGWTVSEADNGQAALDSCSSSMPDVILLDWHIPVLSAAEFLAALRTLRAARRPRVIYCTTENDPIDINKFLLAGADDYLMKPFDQYSLLEKFNILAVA